jgi:hypothetical protein
LGHGVVNTQDDNSAGTVWLRVLGCALESVVVHRHCLKTGRDGEEKKGWVYLVCRGLPPDGQEEALNLWFGQKDKEHHAPMEERPSGFGWALRPKGFEWLGFLFHRATATLRLGGPVHLAPAPIRGDDLWKRAEMARREWAARTAAPCVSWEGESTAGEEAVVIVN